MVFDTSGILREYRGEWLQGNAANPYMTGETVNYLGSIYKSLIDNNSGNISPDLDPNWRLSARGAQVSGAVDQLIGTTASPVTYGSIISASGGSPVVVPPGSPGQLLTSTGTGLTYTTGETVTPGEAPEEVFTHFSRHTFRELPFDPTATSASAADVDLAITSNNKICTINRDGTVSRVFDSRVVPRGEINGVREAVWADRAAFYCIDVNDDLWIQNRHDGNTRFITDDVRTIAVLYFVTRGTISGVNPTTNRVVICKMDGTVYGYGSNSSSRLVPNETTNQSFLDPPVQISGLSDIQRVFVHEAGDAFFASNSANELFVWGAPGVTSLFGFNNAPTMIGQNFVDFASAALNRGNFSNNDGIFIFSTLVSTPDGDVGRVMLSRRNVGGSSSAISQYGVDIPGGIRSMSFRNAFSTSTSIGHVIHVISNSGVLYTGGFSQSIELLRGAGALENLALQLADPAASFSGSVGYERDALVNNEIDHVFEIEARQDLGASRAIVRRGQVIILTLGTGSTAGPARYGGFFPSTVVDRRNSTFLLANGTLVMVSDHNILPVGGANPAFSNEDTFHALEYYLGRSIYVT